MNIYLNDEKIGDYIDSKLRLEYQKDAKKLANAASAHTLREVIEDLRERATEMVSKRITSVSTADISIYNDRVNVLLGLVNKYESLLKGQTDVKEDC